MTTPDLFALTDAGLYCPAGDFHVDPWRPVPRAVVTHAHADHARRGCQRYLCARPGLRVLRTRLGADAVLDSLDYGEAVALGGVRVSLHPAGHVLGSAQVRAERDGLVWVVSGDYKLDPDPTCAPFEPVRCHGFVTESTFGLPIYRWPSPATVAGEVNAWWNANQLAGKCSLLYAYSLGKAQRLLAGLDASLGPIFLHGAAVALTRDYADSGVALPPWAYVGDAPAGTKWDRAIVLAPPSAHGAAWARRFAPSSSAFASGWMTIRGTRRRKAVDRGFVLSDHADWPGLLSAIAATGAERVWATHGYVAPLVRHLRENGLDASEVRTQFEGEAGDGEAAS